MARTVLFYHPDCTRHDSGQGHPERPQRLHSIMEHLETRNLLDQVPVSIPVEAGLASLELIHTSAHIETVSRLAALGRPVAATPDTVVSPSTYRAALLAAGAVQEAIDVVVENRADNCFCVVRPPGHHAEREEMMGFCYFNNVGIAARYLQAQHGIEKVAIIDWDVHHGNGTQHSFEEDPSIFFFSIHQFPHYPGTGSRGERGRGAGSGYTLNAPMPAGSGDSEYLQVFQEELRPAMESFEPDFILISAGFDAHRADPLGAIQLTERGFEALTREVLSMAEDYCGGKVVSTLEGGYDLEATAGSAAAHLGALKNAESH